MDGLFGYIFVMTMVIVFCIATLGLSIKKDLEDIKKKLED